MRLDPRTPARVALDKFVEPHTKKVGRPKITWLATIRRDLKSHNLPEDDRAFVEKLSEMASDRMEWSGLVMRECGMIRKN